MNMGILTEFEVIKLPHHGSNCNISKKILLIFSKQKNIFFNKYEKFEHPDMDVIANLVLNT